MHDAGAPAWREIVEKSHTRLLEELAAAVESDRRKAVDAAVAAEREIAKAEREIAKTELETVKAERETAKAEREFVKAELVAVREKANRDLTDVRESAMAEAKAVRESARAEAKAVGESARAEAKAARESANAEITALREKASAEISALRESASAEAALREKASAETKALRESTDAEIKALHESVSAEKSSRQKAEEQLAAETERAGKLLAAERERASAELKSARERATAELKSERYRASADLTSAGERAAADLNKVRAELTEAAVKSKVTARQAMAESLNQSLRRIRQATSVEATLQFAAELSAAYSHKVVVLVFENNQARVAASRPAPAGATAGRPPADAAAGPGKAVTSAAAPNAPAASIAVNGSGSDRALEADRSITAFDLTLENAPALASAIETRDPVTVLARESEISPVLARLLDAAPAEKVYLFPVIARQQVVAMLVVAGEVFAAAPELLAEAAGMRLEAITETVKKTPSAENLVTIQRAAIPASATSDRHGWDELGPEDQQLHLQAQRVARVRVAKMRLEREDAWRRGLAQSDVYGALRRDIESARTEFLQTFLSKSSTMVDYLHLEILRSLANEDDRVLGREYPGPMV